MRTDPADLVTIPAAARARNLGPRQLKSAIKRNELRAYTIGAWRRVRLADVDRWIASRANVAPVALPRGDSQLEAFLDALAEAVAASVIRELRKEERSPVMEDRLGAT